MEIKDNMLKVLEGKKILFLENDFGLYNTVETFEKFLIDNKLEYNALFNLEKLPTDYILEMVEWYDIIVFETQWVGERAHELRGLLFTHKFQMDKVIIECYIHEPTWYGLPKGLPEKIIGMYQFTDNCEEDLEGMSEWEFNKLD